jgi:hypothetical protein
VIEKRKVKEKRAEQKKTIPRFGLPSCLHTTRFFRRAEPAAAGPTACLPSLLLADWLASKKRKESYKKQKSSSREIDTEPDCTTPLAYTVFPRSQPLREAHEYAARRSSKGAVVPVFFLPPSIETSLFPWFDILLSSAFALISGNYLFVFSTIIQLRIIV